MTQHTFEFEKCGRWFLFKMLMYAWYTKRLSLAWTADEPKPEISQNSNVTLNLHNMANARCEVSETPGHININLIPE